ncbi:hypothetical protein D3C75_1083100 [compost metagenome]
MPAPESRDKAGQRAGEHNSQQQSAHNIAYDPAAVFFSSQIGSIRHQNLRGYRTEANKQGCSQKQRRIGSKRSRYQCSDHNCQRGHCQTAVFNNIAKRHHEQQSNNITDLG